jgi:hypothetical protein
VLIRRGLQGRVTKATTWLTWLAAFALIAVGVLCLSLSGAVARSGTWWQGTWQALGVGFVVGGIVDVLAISTMNQFFSASTWHWNVEASKIIYGEAKATFSSELDMWGDRARSFLRMHGDEIDPELRVRLVQVAENHPPHGF